MTYEDQGGQMIAKVIASPIASVLFHGFPLHGPDITGRFNKRSRFDRPLRKNAAIDEELAEWDARLQTLQRNIAAKRPAQGAIKSA